MKSIMHEASSLAKAIEQGWEKAGKPKDFSIKVLEEAQKNFIGMTTRSAKIAIMFDEKSLPKAEQPQRAPQARAQQQRPLPQRKEAPREVREHREQPQRAQQTKPTPQQQERPTHAPKQQPVTSQQPQEAPKQRAQKQFAPLWNDEMVALAREWIEGTLKTMNLEGAQFTIQPQNFHLRIVFQKPLLADSGKEKQLFASFSTLILETLKGKFRIGLRGHKIVLTHEQ